MVVADEAPRCATHFQHYLGLCWDMVTHLEPQSRKNGRSRNHCKTQYSAGVGGGGVTPLSPSERRDAYGKDTAMAGPRVPLAGFKGLRLTAGRRPTWVCGAYVTPMLALVGPILSKVKLSGAHLGPRLGQVGPMWCMLGTSWAQVEPMLGLCWPMLGLCWPMLGLCWAYVGPMLAYVGPTLAYVGPMLSHLGGYVGHMLGICWLSWAYVGRFMLKKSSETTFYDFFLPAKQKP